ncbi:MULTISPECIES: mandelate racemase/muconate lactonizing enzyme family protein [unclassified Pseudomonas]|uniref:L-talarate/galactarate dehydratase n=1 Tax=unclassified Pseudomonas TaxID=196821 RepID=UPI0008763DA0|nr:MULTISPECIES: mandelate racemase/muconate lactonizing enzyme family protein [unclassified Pseudomonas]SCZ38775.1 L-alanine-DL-glutamate epimerase [Pseudomonas sp. NFACC44-2]SDA77676.1 L-alanine-DL-glutamate epimerase [Pseudomonas sp. NFACC51]SDW06935.1 L-alanine-DL-glutamate epimerase [Pseudomonas sp. NFACC08-1]SEJ78270.1 L-alanine-DL-glutamate epimerase [Pseudomonas sp. NFACC07-1]SFI07398.1 L-alanine-DL-glutamate epimerase [Pseudomonas sp. NFACC54]
MQDTPQMPSADDDRIAWVRVASVFLPLANPISDAKVLTGRQKPMTEIAILFVEIETRDGHRGLGFSYSKRAGGPGQFAHAQEIAPSLIGENPSDISKLWDKLCWAGASVGRSGLATQAIGAFDVALWDLKAKRANLSLARLLGAHRDSVQCYNTSGGFLHTPLDQLMINTELSREKGIGGIKLKVGQPDQALDLHRVSTIRKHLGDDFPLMVDANQQWDRPTAQRMCRRLEQFNLIWIEEPLDCYDAEGHAALAREFDTPIATGEMLTSVAEHWEFIKLRATDYLMPDAPRVGGITPYLKVQALAEQAGLMIAPHFAMELHIHLAATYSREPWVEHFEWLEPLFNERMQTRDGRMLVPTRPGLGLSLSERVAGWTANQAAFGQRP